MASSQAVAVEYIPEVSFCENLTTATTRIPALAGSIRVDLQEPKIANMSAQVRTNAVAPPHNGPRRATLEFDVYLSGRGALGNTATTAWWLHSMLASGLGGGSRPGLGTTAITAGSDADTTVMTIPGVDNGQMWRVGARGDGRAEGRWGVAAASSASQDINSLVGFGGTCQDADVVYTADVAYPTESGQGSERFLVHFKTAGTGAMLHGCVLTGLKLSTWKKGESPKLTFTYTCAYWQHFTAGSFPLNATVGAESCDAVMGGYYFLQASGTTTFSAICPSEATLEIELGTQLKEGQCSGNAFANQSFSGFERTYTKARVGFKIPTWSSDYESMHALDGTSTAWKHILMCTGVTAGRSCAVYLPRVQKIDPVSVPEDSGGALGVSVMFEATEAITPEDVNDLSKSLFRLALG